MRETRKKTYLVEFVQERQVQVSEGESLLEASLAAGIPHYHACGGNARCSTCHVLITEGADRLTPPNQREKALGEKMKFPPNVRLACQTYMTGGPVRVHRIIRDQTDIDLYVGAVAGEATQALGEERDLALFFLDIRNFTPFIESHLPFDVIHIVRRLFAIFRGAIEANYGRVIETAGDGLYAVFGLEVSITEAAQYVVQAGFSILDHVVTFNETYLQTHFIHRLEVGMGLHIGKVICGNIGLDVNDGLTVMGYPVNVAARLQAATKELNNSFVVSEDIFRLLTEPPLGVPRTTVNLRGIEGPVHVYLMGKPYQNVPGRKAEVPSAVVTA
jgi:adenylate cyclase